MVSHSRFAPARDSLLTVSAMPCEQDGGQVDKGERMMNPKKIFANFSPAFTIFVFSFMLFIIAGLLSLIFDIPLF